MYRFLLILILQLLALSSLAQNQLRVGSERMEILLPLLKEKRVALMVNQSSIVGVKQAHLLDTLLSQGIQVQRIFVPEHGFRGDVDAGKYVRNGKDHRTGIPITSLYGKNKRPTAEMLQDVDVLLYDLQDVGTRFYTYISSLHYLMEVAQEQNKLLIVADRPNPSDYIDGPILESDCRSFIGMHPIPLVHGLTVGELAQMINGEAWLRSKKPCQLKVIPIEGWRHGDAYSLPVRPSPNLQSDRAIELYPTLCLFEATIMSVGRGTDKPFHILGYPHKGFGNYSFMPVVKKGADSNPRYKGQMCYGIDFTNDVRIPRGTFSIEVFIQLYHEASSLGFSLIDRPRTFELLIGNKRFARQIREGQDAQAIRASWQEDLDRYKTMRKRYLLYPDYPIPSLASQQ